MGDALSPVQCWLSNSLFAFTLSSIPNVPESLIQCKVWGPASSLSMLPALSSAAAGIGMQASIGTCAWSFPFGLGLRCWSCGSVCTSECCWIPWIADLCSKTKGVSGHCLMHSVVTVHSTGADQCRLVQKKSHSRCAGRCQVLHTNHFPVVVAAWWCNYNL